MTRIERLTNVILLLQERSRTSEEISRLLEVSRRTVIRDMMALCEMGVPIIAQGGVGGGYSLAGEYSIRPLQLTWREAMLLMLSLSSLSKMTDSPFSEERASLSAKVASLLPSRHLERINEFLKKVDLEVPERRRAPHLDALVEAAGTGQWIRMTYDSPDGATDIAMRPDRVFADRGTWYVDGVSAGVRRWYRADRVMQIEPCDPVEHVEPLPYTHESHPEVRVKLTPRGARVVERDPHLGSQVQDAKGKEVLLAFRCPPEELDWYAKYFGGMGADAVVQGPPELVLKVRARAQALLDLYG